MAIPNRRACNGYQARVDGRLQYIDGDLSAYLLACGTKNVAQGGVLVERDKQQRGLGELWKLRGLRGEGPLQPFRHGQAPQSALAAIGPLTPQSTRQLEQRERVAN